MKAFKLYPFTLGAGGSQVFLAEGAYVRVKTATGDVALTLDDIGPFGPISTGQGFSRAFRRVVLTDMSGAANAGTLIVADASFIDQTLAGTVQVIDGEKARTLAGGAFTAGLSVNALAANYSVCQVWNPAGSGKNIILRALSFSASGTGTIYVNFDSAARTTDLSASLMANKKAGGALGSGQARAENTVVGPSGAIWSSGVAAGVFLPWTPQGGLALPPGKGLYAIHNTVNTTLSMNAEWFEESVT